MSGNDTTRRRALKVAGDTTVVALAGCMGGEEDEGYLPLWAVSVDDNTDFADASNLESATAATVLDTDTATVNCPIVSAGTE